jgi:hypothetical protein
MNDHQPLREAAEAATAGVVERVRKRIAEIDRHVSEYPSWVGGTTAQHADDCRSLLDEIAGLRAALEMAAWRFECTSKLCARDPELKALSPSMDEAAADCRLALKDSSR